MKEGMTMHYPYNPGISKPPFGYEVADASVGIDPSKTVQNTMPPSLGPPSQPAPIMPGTPSMPGAPAMPGTPSMPGAPTMPGTPSMPGAPTTPTPAPTAPTPPPTPTTLTPAAPSAPPPTFPTPPESTLPGTLGPLPGTTFPFETSPGAIMPPVQPIFPLPTTPVPIRPVPILPSETDSAADVTVTRPPLVQTVVFEDPDTVITGSPIPTVVPSPPHFSVPGNPLLPQEYKEILSYESLQYMNGFMRTQIGKECLVTMEFGGGASFSRFGYLVGVGLNYLLLQDPCSNEILVCDFYSVRLIELLGRRCPVDLNIQ